MVLPTVVHDGGGDVLAGDALSPGGLDVEVQAGLSAVLSRVFLRGKQMLVFWRYRAQNLKAKCKTALLTRTPNVWADSLKMCLTGRLY